MANTDPLLAPIPGADSRTLNGVQVDVAPAGTGRIKRVIYQPGFRWSTHMKSTVGTDLCMHAHVGFIARGSDRHPLRRRHDASNSPRRRWSRSIPATTAGSSATSRPC